MLSQIVQTQKRLLAPAISADDRKLAMDDLSRLDDEELLRIHTEGAPLILMGQLPQTGISSVDVDNVGGAALATQHLISLGHKRIGLITNQTGVDRLGRRNVDAMLAAGVKVTALFSPEHGIT